MKGFKSFRWFSCILAAFVILCTGIVSANAATINVTANATDTLNGANGQCSLREAITNINNGATTYADCATTGIYGTNDTINIPAGTYTTIIAGVGEDLNATGDYDILKSVTIAGAGSGSTTINGGGLDRVFHITGAYTVSIFGVTITNGFSPWAAPWGGGGITNSGGTVTITNSIISGNTANPSGVGNGWGGGIYNASGTLTVINSTVSGNTANGTGSNGNGGGIGVAAGTVNITNSTISGNTAIYAGGGIMNFATLTVTNSTISGNTAVVGGGIFNQTGTATVTSTTISSNSANTGGGIYGFSGTVTSSSSIVANQTSGGDCFGTIVSSGYNLESVVSCGFVQTGDLRNANPLLGALANNGGPTQTMALSVGSPAINTGSNAICAAAPVNGIDQRGYTRPAACDIGAFEYNAVVQQYTVTANANGTGTGTVQSNVGGINYTYQTASTGTTTAINYGTSFIVTATAGAGSTVSWGGTCIAVGGTEAGDTAIATCTFANLNSNQTVTATFTLNTYTVTPSAGAGGTISPNIPQTVNYGSTTSFTVTPNAGYTASVAGTCGGALVGTTYTTIAITANCTVVVSFTLNTYTVTPSAGAGGTISPSIPQTVNYNGTALFTVTPNAGYSISSVTGCGGTLSGTTYITGSITANCTVTASFSANPVNGVCGSSNGGTFTTSPTGNLCLAGTASAVSGSGPWTWTCNGANGGTNASCSAGIQSFTVTPSAGTGGTISPSTPVTINYGSTTSFTVTPNTGYTISSVSGCGGTLSGNTYTTGPITANCSVSASFAASTFTVTASAGVGGSISPSSATVNSGNTTSFTVTPNTGYHIASVTGCGGTLSGNTYTTGPITANCSVTAAFANTFTVTPVVGSHGTIDPAGPIEVPAGGSLTISISPDPGYIANVVIDGVPIGSMNKVTFFNVTGPHTIEVTFTLK